MGRFIIKAFDDLDFDENHSLKEINENCVTFDNTPNIENISEEEQNNNLKKFIAELDKEIDDFEF